MTPLEQASAILKAAEEASTAPWKLDTTQNLGDNWMIGTLLWVGSDEDKDGQFSDYIVTTDRVRASEFTGQGPQADAAFIALARNTAPAIALALIEKHRALEAARARSHASDRCA